MSEDNKGLGQTVRDFERGYRAGQGIGWLGGMLTAAGIAVVIWLATWLLAEDETKPGGQAGQRGTYTAPLGILTETYT